jgi:hypothetical protein
MQAHSSLIRATQLQTKTKIDEWLLQFNGLHALFISEQIY